MRNPFKRAQSSRTISVLTTTSTPTWGDIRRSLVSRVKADGRSTKAAVGPKVQSVRSKAASALRWAAKRVQG